jgi:hypothetical protein
MASSLLCRCPCTTTSSSKPAPQKSAFLPQVGENFVRNAVRPGRGKRELAVRALEFDQDTLVAISVGVAGLAVGIGVPIFYESQVKSSEQRENDQPCFPCNGTGSQVCRFCVGAGNITVELGGGEREVSRCINCEGSGSLTCTTCQGTGVQPRYLDRREYKDDD